MQNSRIEEFEVIAKIFNWSGKVNLRKIYLHLYHNVDKEDLLIPQHIFACGQGVVLVAIFHH